MKREDFTKKPSYLCEDGFDKELALVSWDDSIAMRM